MIKRALLIGSLLLLAACSEEPKVNKPNAAFETTIQRRGDVLEISYLLRNHGTEPMVAYVGVPGDAASHAWDVYVTARDNGVVEIAKRTFDIPNGVNADAIGRIEGVVIQPGAEFKEDFEVSLPLKGRRPYVSNVKLPDPVKQIVFCVGAVAQKEAASPKPASTPERGLYPDNGPQHLFCSEPLSL